MRAYLCRFRRHNLRRPLKELNYVTRRVYRAKGRCQAEATSAIAPGVSPAPLGRPGALSIVEGTPQGTEDAIFFIYPLDKQRVGQAKPQKAAVTSQASTETQPSQVPGAVVLFVGFRVGAAGYPAAPPTDPDVNNSLIRVLGSTPSYRSRCQTGDTPVGA